MQKKKCRACGIEKLLAEFTYRPSIQKYSARCRFCLAGDMREKRRTDAAARLNELAVQRRNRKSRYATDPEYRAKQLAIRKTYYAALPEEEKKRRGFKNALMTNYRMTPEEYRAMLESQGGGCACCGRMRKKMTVDHDHLTGAVRGILCSSCNTGIGLFGDTAFALERAITYLHGRKGALGCRAVN